MCSLFCDVVPDSLICLAIILLLSDGGERGKVGVFFCLFYNVAYNSLSSSTIILLEREGGEKGGWGGGLFTVFYCGLWFPL